MSNDVPAHAREGSPAAEHLDAARTHLLRACLALKAAATAEPSLVTALGTPHAVLSDVLRDLQERASA